MPVNKNAQMRYLVLDKCFRNTGRCYFIEDLMEECNKMMMEVNPDSKNISRRQIFHDINFMESSEGWSIDLERIKEGRRTYYRYSDPRFSINNMPLSELEVNQLRSAIEAFSHLSGMPQFEWMHDLHHILNVSVSPKTIIAFDNNSYLRGIEHIGTLYNAVLYEQVLDVCYHPFTEKEAYHLEFHPYFLKQRNNRWFVFGYNPAKERYDWNIALDRIVEIKQLPDDYIPNTDIDWNEYFEDIVGVTKPVDGKMEKIVLRFEGITGKYVESKPVHGSQRAKWLDDGRLEVSLKLIVNYEFKQWILSYADSVEVVEPQPLREFVKEKARKVEEMY